MVEGIWEIGVLLIGIGVLFALVYLGLLLKQVTVTVKKVDFILDRNSREIEDIIYSSSRLLNTVDEISYSVSNFSPIAAILGLNKMRKTKKSRRRD